MTTLPATMSGVVLTGHGGPECLQWRDDLPVPHPGPGDVIVRIGAAAVNNTDINTRVGWYSRTEAADDASWSGGALAFPRIQGIDGCGHIAAVGAGVDPTRIGERVLLEPCITEAAGQPLPKPWFLGSECDGSFAQFARIAARHAHRIDSRLTDADLATFPCSYSTAENMLHRAGVTAGDRVLVTGASGGVGSAAVQLARARGAEVIALSSPAKAAELTALGATQTLNRAIPLRDQLPENSVDVVIDLIGGDTWMDLIDTLRPHGRLAVAGAVAGPIVALDLRQLYLKDLRFYGCTALDNGVFANLIKHIEAGRIKPLRAATYPLKDIAKAQEAFAAKSFTGKIALEVEIP